MHKTYVNSGGKKKQNPDKSWQDKEIKNTLIRHTLTVAEKKKQNPDKSWQDKEMKNTLIRHTLTVVEKETKS